MDFLLKQAKRCNFNLLITSMIILTTAVLISLYPMINYYHSFQSYKELDIQKAKAGAYSLGLFSDNYFIETDEYIDLGTEPYTALIKNGEEIIKIENDDDYLLVKKGDYWLPVHIQDNTRENLNNFKGKVAGINDNVFEEIKSKTLKKQGAEFDTKKILNMCLDTTVSDKSWSYFAFVISGILLLIFLINIIKLIKRRADPYKCPVFNNLIIYGDIQELEQSINLEMETEGFSAFDKMIVTDNWFLIKRFYTVEIAPLSQIVWIYTKTEWKRWNGIIPIYKVTKLNIVLRNELHYEAFFRSQRKSAEKIEKLKTALPWIITEYSNEIRKLCDSNFDRLVERVDNEMKNKE